MTDEENTPADEPHEETSAGEVNETGTTSEERTLAMLAHAGPAAVILVTAGYGGWLVPLIIWLVKKDDSEFVGTHAKEALNLQLSAFIANLISIPLIFACGIGIVTLILVTLFALVFGIIAGIKAYEGAPYRYPYILRLIN